MGNSTANPTARRWARLGALALTVGLTVAGATAPGHASVHDRNAKPRSGGEVTFGLEAENTNYCLSTAQMAASGIQVAAAVYDTLTVPDANGVAVPYLAKSVEPNADSTVWTVTLRDGVKFHDGTPVDAAAVKLNLDALRGTPGAPNVGSLFPIVLRIVQDVTVTDPSTVTITLTAPVPSFRNALYGGGRFGMMAPAQLNAGDDCATKMIGSGPFKLESYAQNEKTVVVKNDDYWQEGFPKLDRITFVPVPDAAVRTTRLQGGQLDLMHTTNAEQSDAVENDASLKALVQKPGYRELRYYIMLTNNAPFDDPVAREAFTTAIDRAKVNEIRNQGERAVANSLMDTKAPGHLANAGYPAFDLKKAKKLVDQVKARTGGRFDVVLGVTIDPANSAEAQLVKEMLDKAGINSSIALFDQATLINKALAGDIDVLFWRNLHGGFSDSANSDNYPWWSNFTVPTGGRNLINFARFDDAATQAALDAGRGAASRPAARRAYTDFNRAFAAGNYIAPMWWDVWTVGYRPSVRLTLPPLPDGQGKSVFVGGRIPLIGLSSSG